MVSPLTHFKSISQKCHVEIVTSFTNFPAILSTLTYSSYPVIDFCISVAPDRRG